MRYRFGEYELNDDTVELRGPDGALHVEPQVYDVLLYLLANRDRVVTKEELLDEVWGDRFVSESALTTRIKTLRRLLGDNGRDQHTVRTVHGRGYQFVADVGSVIDSTDGSGGTAAPAPGDALRRLPATNDPIRGRSDDLETLGRLLDDEMLVTVVGPGGTGKTRLCVEYGHLLPPDEPVAFVDLGAVRDGAALGQALVAALSVDATTASDPVEACCGFLRARPTLLIVDNCEHVAEAAARLVQRVLDEAPATTVVATSRVPLGVRDESVLRLQPLAVLDDQHPAVAEAAANPCVELFVDRAARVHRDFELDEETAAVVVALCRALDGLPLAVELAASRLATFGLDDIVERLDRRLDLLGDDRLDAHERHRTLRATLEWSIDLLDDDCRRLFDHLSVFPAGLPLDGIEWLGGCVGAGTEPALVLSTLVEASLVVRVETPGGTRYRQLETMRTFGRDELERAGRLTDARDCLANWAVALTAELAGGLDAEAEVYWNDRFRRELPNLREARAHLRASGRIGELIGLSMDVDEFAQLRDIGELWDWTDDLRQVEGLDAASAARVTAMAAQAAWRRGRIDEARRLATTALASDDGWARSRAFTSLATAKLFAADFEGAAADWAARVAIDGKPEDRANEAIASAYAGDVDRARELMVALRADHTDPAPGLAAWFDYVSGEIASVAGDDDAAVALLQSAVTRAEAAGQMFIAGVAGVTLFTTSARRGEVVDAARQGADLVDIWLRSGTWTQLWTTLRHAAALVAPDDPALALLIIDKAGADPWAPEMDATACADLEGLRADLVTRLGTDIVVELESTAATLDRADLAERTRRALLTVAAG